MWPKALNCGEYAVTKGTLVVGSLFLVFKELGTRSSFDMGDLVVDVFSMVSTFLEVGLDNVQVLINVCGVTADSQHLEGLAVHNTFERVGRVA